MQERRRNSLTLTIFRARSVHLSRFNKTRSMRPVRESRTRRIRQIRGRPKQPVLTLSCLVLFRPRRPLQLPRVIHRRLHSENRTRIARQNFHSTPTRDETVSRPRRLAADDRRKNGAAESPIFGARETGNGASKRALQRPKVYWRWRCRAAAHAHHDVTPRGRALCRTLREINSEMHRYASYAESDCHSRAASAKLGSI